MTWPGWVGLWAILLTNFFLSPVFPTTLALGIKLLRPNTKLVGSLIVMAIIGGAVLTWIKGLIARLVTEPLSPPWFRWRVLLLRRLRVSRRYPRSG